MNLAAITTTIVRQLARIPVTLAVVLLAVVIAYVPSAAEMFQFNRAAIAAGETWRLATGHLTHWNAEHLQWDLLMFVVLGTVCEMRNPRQMRRCVVAAAGVVSVLVFCVFTDIDTYRGLSGIDTALFTLLAIELMRDARRQRSGMSAFVTGGLLLGFVAKTAYEAVTGQAMFVEQQSAGFELLVWDHIVAAVVGALFATGIERNGPSLSSFLSLRRKIFATRS
ncbi:MAG: rhombosortase [Pirellulales bacterium]